VNDSVLLSAILGTAAMITETWLALPAAIAMAGGLVGLFFPGVASVAFVVASYLVLLLLIYDVIRKH
jgi:hypothetical protein